MSVPVHKHDSFDWEPAVIAVRSRSTSATSKHTLFALLSQWLQDRSLSCACYQVYLSVEIEESDLIVIRCEWLCSTCLESFLGYVESIVPDVFEIHLGVATSQADAPISKADNEREYLCVPEKEVELESGEVVQTDQVTISRHPVSIDEYRIFANDSGYQTLAERCDDVENCYYCNSVIAGWSEAEIARGTASCLCYLDAVAFCHFYGLRLPSEVEWLAAAVIEDGEISAKEYRERIPSICKSPTFLYTIGAEVTGTLEDDQRCVLRRGPIGIRQEHWRERVGGNRLVTPIDYYDCMTSFRVVKD